MKKLTLILLLITSIAYAQYPSQNVTLLSTWDDITVPAESYYGIRYNGIWGWTSPNGMEYAIIGATTGTYIINVSNPATPVVCDFVPGCRVDCIWRELKTYQNFLFMVSDDSPPNCLQVADLSYLPDSVHVVHESDNIIETAHTIFIDDHYLYAASPRGGVVGNSASMAVYDIINPATPVLLRKLNQDDPSVGGVHDMLVKNDTVYASAGFDGLHIYLYDTGANVFTIYNSVTVYPGSGYNHSTAITTDSKTLVVADEVPTGLPLKTFDITDFSNITIPTTFRSTQASTATPHNPFMMKDNYCVVSYYQDGVQIFDVSNPAAPVRTGYIDTNPTDGLGLPNPSYSGSWGSYVEFPSGNIVASDMQNGLFVIDPTMSLGITSAASNSNNLIVYPNPVQNFLQLHFSTAAIYNVELMDITGKTIFSKVTNGSQVVNFDMSNINKGIYIIKASNDDTSFVKQVVKQ